MHSWSPLLSTRRQWRPLRNVATAEHETNWTDGCKKTSPRPFVITRRTRTMSTRSTISALTWGCNDRATLSPSRDQPSSATVQTPPAIYGISQRFRSHSPQLHAGADGLHRTATRLPATWPSFLTASPGNAHHRIPQNPPDRLPHDRRQRRHPLASLHTPVPAHARRSTDASPRILPAS